MIVYTEEMFEKDIQTLVELIRRSEIKYHAVCGISLGGDKIAQVLAKALHLPIREQDELPGVHKERVKDNVLVVDIYAGRGNIRDKYSKHDFACLHLSTVFAGINEINYWACTQEDSIDYSFLLEEEEEISQNKLQQEITSIVKSIDDIVSDNWSVDSFTLNIKRKQ